MCTATTSKTETYSMTDVRHTHCYKNSQSSEYTDHARRFIDKRKKKHKISETIQGQLKISLVMKKGEKPHPPGRESGQKNESNCINSI